VLVSACNIVLVFDILTFRYLQEKHHETDTITKYEGHKDVKDGLTDDNHTHGARALYACT